ncbi:MAG TPA: phosphotransferase family protein [Polyangiales bacterium]|nr:phosphotransferase family protein [Polyangiales bacterium]
MERTELLASHTLPIDEPALRSYLESKLPDEFRGVLEVQKFAGGQSNPTYKLTANGKSFVLRKKPPGTLLATAHMVDREYRVISALYGSGVPVAKPILYCDDAKVIGTEFFIMEYVGGRIFWDPTFPQLSAAERAALYAEMARVLAALHMVDYSARGLGSYGKAGNYFARQIKRWTEQYLASVTEPIPSMDALIKWLPEHVPADEKTSLVHGDYRFDNMVFHPTEPRVLAVLDWELSTLGHPLADLAYNCMSYHLPGVDRPPLAELAGPESGIPTEAEYVAEYCRHTGQKEIPSFGFYLAFSAFRYASIVQGVVKRGLSGNASSGKDALGYVTRVKAAANKGWELAQKS